MLRERVSTASEKVTSIFIPAPRIWLWCCKRCPVEFTAKCGCLKMLSSVNHCMHPNHWPSASSTTGHVDLWAEGRRQDQHRCVSPQLWSQLPRLTGEGPSQLHAQSSKPGQSLHWDKQCKDDRWGEVHLRVCYLPQRQRARHHVPRHAG